MGLAQSKTQYYNKMFIKQMINNIKGILVF